MNPYKGIVKITCVKNGRCQAVDGQNMLPGCMACPEAVVKIIDLDDQAIFELKKPGRPISGDVLEPEPDMV